MRHLRRSILVFSAVVVGPSSGTAQATKSSQAQLTLSAGERIGTPIESVVGIRELADGSVLVADPKAKQIVLVATRAPNRQIGRDGDGPGEYRTISSIVRAAGEDAIAVDGQARRYLFLHGASISRMAAADISRLADAYASLTDSDSSGRHLAYRGFALNGASREPLRYPSSVEGADSLLVLRFSLSSATVDTIARIRGGWRGQRLVQRSFKGMPITYQLFPMPFTNDQAAVCADGWIVIARVEAAQVTWFDQNARIRTSAHISSTPVRLDDALKVALIEAHVGRERATMFRPEDVPNWPTVLPPFERDGLRCGPRGEALVELSVRPGAARAYEVFTRDGRSARLALPAHQRVVGFGRRSVYVSEQLEDDLLQLVRYDWPLR